MLKDGVSRVYGHLVFGGITVGQTQVIVQAFNLQDRKSNIITFGLRFWMFLTYGLLASTSNTSCRDLKAKPFDLKDRLYNTSTTLMSPCIIW